MENCHFDSPSLPSYFLIVGWKSMSLQIGLLDCVGGKRYIFRARCGQVRSKRPARRDRQKENLKSCWESSEECSNEFLYFIHRVAVYWAFSWQPCFLNDPLSRPPARYVKTISFNAHRMISVCKSHFISVADVILLLS